ncbi:hypothetical protein [Agrilutibacter solisilvae]|uniref:Uncharacterized protein n=1 Tax=Agrilutibacter solisilvae TaxID=2763317 RepID=A0A975AS62_9GAMM|nr:hypothetical protein [Lysobacter solisilvae]QSX77948.1 hypothetical protein I8J32_014655 [Lysobacter solisilvae]
MTEPVGAIDSDLVLAQRKVLAWVGQNVVSMQLMESMLKTVLAVMDGPGSFSITEVKKRSKAVAGKTLGSLVEDLLSNLPIDVPEVKEGFKRRVKQRNRLVHHFHADNGVEFRTVEGCASIVAKLQAEQALIREFNASLQGMLLAIGAGMRSAILDWPELAEFDEMMLRLLESTDSKYWPTIISMEMVPAC